MKWSDWLLPHGVSKQIGLPKVLGSLVLLVTGGAGLEYAATHLMTPADAAIRTQLEPPMAPTPVAVPKEKKKKRHLLAGLASWYGAVLDGHTTASGEIFHKEALTACHPTLPFGTLVRVINLRNRRSVVVRITDRGVLFPNRVIDLSSAAAMQIGMLRRGLAPVRLEVLSPARG